MPTVQPSTPADAEVEDLTTFTFVVEDFCWNRKKVDVLARDREHASEKLQEKISAPISAAWVPARGERAP
jgi:hypothetical protein